jgi:hypothetical protein
MGILVLGCSTNTRDVDEETLRRASELAHGGTAETSHEERAGEIVAAGLHLVPPEGWEQVEPASRMRAAQFRLPSSDPGLADGEVAIFHFGVGGGGGLEDNLRRWANQFVQEDGADPWTRAKLDTLKVGELTVITIEITGRYQSGGMLGGMPKDEPGWRLLGAIVRGPGGPWYIKGVGPEKVMNAHEEAFLRFLKSASL